MKRLKLPRLGLPLWLVACCVAMLVLGYLAQVYWLPQGWPLQDRFVAANATTEIAPVGQVVISEAMSSNKTAWPGADGLYGDWVELYNKGDAPVDISGWTLTDNPNRKIKFTFENHVMQPGEYLLVYLTGNLQPAPGKPYQAPFKLSASGDALLLYNQSGAIAQAMNLPALSADTAYALEGASGNYRATGLYTPGLANTRSNHEALTQHRVQSPVVINELMAKDRTTLKDGDGDYSGWVELYNAGDEAVDLNGYGLSDNPGNLLKWRMPQVTLAPGQSLIVFLSGKDRSQGELHAGFKLATEGECLCLSDPSGGLIQRVDFDLLKADQALSRDSDGNYALRPPTPGRANQ